MNMTKAFAPFEGLVDDSPPTPEESRAALLKRAKRGFVPVRKEFVQKRRGATGEPRGSMLAKFVTSKQGRALDALLLVHGLYPVTRSEPLDTRAWARLLSAGTRCTPNAASKAFSVLEEMQLIRRELNGRQTFITPLSETGDGSEWTRAGEDKDEDGPGFFTIPHAYWIDGLAEKLTMPGKAMLLVLLHDTNSPKTMTFTAPLDRMSEWYGISERTAERGYKELRAAGVLAEHDRKVVDHKHPAGRRLVRHRALRPPFDTFSRMSLQGKARTAVKKKNEKLEEVSSAQ
jgi:DNA-binding transcriptional regulator YhcF (GntR family)